MQLTILFFSGIGYNTLMNDNLPLHTNLGGFGNEISGIQRNEETRNV